MAELVAIIASAVACVQGTEMLIKYSRRLYRFGKQIKFAGDDIKTFAHDVEMFTNTIIAACNAIKAHALPGQASYQPVMQYLLRKNLIMRALEQYATVRERVLEEIPPLAAFKDKHELHVRFNWGRRKKHV